VAATAALPVVWPLVVVGAGKQALGVRHVTVRAQGLVARAEEARRWENNSGGELS
jgi:hypothetical protein